MPQRSVPGIPGYRMPNLVKLAIEVDDDTHWHLGLVRTCADLCDPAFCPKLSTLPNLRMVSPGLDELNLSINAQLQVTCGPPFRRALQELRARGIRFSPEEIEGTMWAHATSEEVMTS